MTHPPPTPKVMMPPPGGAPYPWTAPPQTNPVPRELRPVIRPWPPFKSLKGPLIGWDADFAPYVLFKPQDAADWFAVGLHYDGVAAVVRPTAYKLIDENEDLIKTWTHNFNGPDPSAAAREMQNEEVRELTGAVGQAPPTTGPFPLGAFSRNAKTQFEATSLMRRMVDAITGKKT